MLKKFVEWREEAVLNEMAARRSFWRTINKFAQNGAISVQKPIAILTAFRADLPGSPESILAKNRSANETLKNKLGELNFSYYPILGFGQEEDVKGKIKTQKEESFIIQPRKEMSNDQFSQLVKSLCFDDNSQHRQWGAVVKLPDQSVTLVHHDGDPKSSADYNQADIIGNTAKMRKGSDPYYSQMVKGPPRQFVVG